jgi:hypothetical protein
MLSHKKWQEIGGNWGQIPIVSEVMFQLDRRVGSNV